MRIRLSKKFDKSKPGPHSSHASIRAVSCLAFLLGIFQTTFAHATLTISSVSPYVLTTGNVIYFSESALSVDTGAGFHAFDLTATSGGSDLVYLDVSSNKNFGTLNSGQDVVVTVTVNGNDVPIARAGAVGAVSDCSSSNCQAYGSSKYYAAKYSTSGQILRIAFYPKEICSRVVTLSGVCSGGSVVTPTSGSPTVIPVKIYIGIESSDGGIGSINDSEEHASVSLNFQSTAPTFFPCPTDLSTAYTPGDTEIIFDASAFTVANITGAAPVDTMVVLAKETTAGAIGAIDSDGQITARIPSSGAAAIGGFTNTTDGTDHLYDVMLYARDQSGALSLSCSSAAPNYLVQTAKIQGLLAKSQCFIATAAYRSAKDPAVVMLREFRDGVLRSSWIGRRLVDLYYRLSPPIAEVMIQYPELRAPVLALLAPIQVWVWCILNLGWIFLILCLSTPFIFHARVRRLLGVVVFVGTGVLVSSSTRAEEEVSLIEQIRSEHSSETKDSSIQPYIDQQKQKLQPAEEEGSLIDSIRGQSPGADTKEQGYAEKKKKELSEAETSGGAIEAVKAGKSKLEAKKDPRVGNAFGLTISVRQTRDVSAESGAVYKTYDSMYGTGYTPDFQFFYESQPLHGEWLGSLGFFGQVGFAWKRAAGTYEFSLARPGVGNGNFPSASSTDFTFVTVPLTAGGIYRFNLLRFARPYVKAGATLIGYVEDRSDHRGTYWGQSRGFLTGAGVAFPL
ncbi:hypothetical protein EBZ37_08335, partial [bacterium]|nr:hypothetical protein [bacterium]